MRDLSQRDKKYDILFEIVEKSLCLDAMNRISFAEINQLFKRVTSVDVKTVD